MPKNIEIERKFLVSDDSYKQSATSCVRICQGYLTLNERCSVRVRIWDDKGFITIKSKPILGSFSRFEWEKEIAVTDAEQLLALALPGKIDKKRWIVPLRDGLTCEVDEFLGSNAGLVVAEIELEREDQAYEHPAFLGKEVTTDTHYLNSYLSQHPYRTWENHNNL